MSDKTFSTLDDFIAGHATVRMNGEIRISELAALLGRD